MNFLDRIKTVSAGIILAVTFGFLVWRTAAFTPISYLNYLPLDVQIIPRVFVLGAIVGFFCVYIAIYSTKYSLREIFQDSWVSSIAFAIVNLVVFFNIGVIALATCCAIIFSFLVTPVMIEYRRTHT